jgi:hypothetical protein
MVVTETLASGPGSCREVAQRACLSVDVARYTLNDMRSAGELKVTTRPEPGVKRPVPVYHLVPAKSNGPPGEATTLAVQQLQAALSTWWLDELVGA